MSILISIYLLERIRNSYRKLEEFLEIEILSKLSSKEEELMALMEEAKRY